MNAPTQAGDPEWGSAVRRRILAGQGPSDEGVASVVAIAHPQLAAGAALAVGRAEHVRLLGLGPLAAYVEEATVTDVLVNGDGRIWVDRGGGVEPVPTWVPPGELRGLAVRLAGMAGRRLDDAQPWVDGLLPGGVRLHALLPPLADGAGSLALRMPRQQPIGVAGLVSLGSVHGEMADVLRALVSARASFVVTGGTGAGKTTVLGALLAECDARDRIVVVEDVRELDPAHPHVVRLQGRSANVEGVGAVPLESVVRQALRMRPDRLIVGEVRGAEVRELLAALNTGHQGGGGTVHANRPEDLPARFEALGALAGLSREGVHAQLRGAVQVVVHTSRRDGVRLVESVGVLRPSPDRTGEVVVERALEQVDDRLIEGPGARWLPWRMEAAA